jgi:hypothetical protein
MGGPNTGGDTREENTVQLPTSGSKPHPLIVIPSLRGSAARSPGEAGITSEAE